MSRNKYALACTNIEAELIGSLTKEDVDALRRRCTDWGLEGFLQWADENFAIIAPYIETPLSQRMKVEAWNEPEVKGLLVLGAIYNVRTAWVLLANLARIEHEIDPRLPYRRLVTNAADLYHEISFEKIDYWPFDDPDPFSSETP